ncbi:MAG: protein kinase, partial [Planctomycetales bacterium]|nr:protein kinase [Planctomycetales bacterium]
MDPDDSSFSITPAEEFYQAWRRGQQPSVASFLGNRPQLTVWQQASVLRVDQRCRWEDGHPLAVEHYMERYPQVLADDEVLLDLIFAEFLLRDRHAPPADLNEFEHRFPQYIATLKQQVGLHRLLDETTETSELHVPGYEIFGTIARGGTSVVYRARHIALERDVALKVLSAGPHSSGSLRQRFLSEASGIAQLRHPNVVMIHDVGQYQGHPYMALELADCGTLATAFAGQALPSNTAAQLIASLAEAMHAVHQLGIVHRDLKPSNVLLFSGPSPERSDVAGDQPNTLLDAKSAFEQQRLIPKVSDFGLAKFLQSTTADLTQSGDMIGTPAYMAPEQVTGNGPAVGPPTDVYALGAILYELLTGIPLYSGRSPFDALRAVARGIITPPRQLVRRIPRDLETICMKCLELDPARRYATAGELTNDLTHFLQKRPISARPSSWWQRGKLWARRRPTTALLLASLAVLIAAACGFWRWHLLRERNHDIHAQVKMLAASNTMAVPNILSQTFVKSSAGERFIEEEMAGVSPFTSAWMHLQLARLRYTSEKPAMVIAKELAQYLESANPDEVELLVTELKPWLSQLSGELWNRLQSGNPSSEERLRLASLLSHDTSAPIERWSPVASMLANDLMNANPLEIPRWARLLSPIGTQLIAPLTLIFQSGEYLTTQRGTASVLIGEFAQGNASTLVPLLIDATPSQYLALWPYVVAAPNALNELLDVVKQRPVDDQNAWTNGSEQQWIEMRTQRDRRHRRYAIAAIALAQLEHVDSLKGVLAESPDNSVRSLTIELAGPLGLSPSHLLSLLETSADGVQRQAALLALGHYTRPKWHEAEMAVIRNALQSHATQCHDAGERAALLWLANHNYVDPARLPSATSDVEEDLRQPTSTHPIYMTTSQRQLLVICPAGTVAMGSPPYEEDHEDDEIVHAVIISQAFALSATEVTVEQFLRYSTN